MHSTNRESGASLIAAIFLITALAVLGALSTKITQFRTGVFLDEWYSAQALYAAESGMDWAVYKIIHDGDTCTPITSSPPHLVISSNPLVTAEISVTCTTPGTSTDFHYYEIVSTGKAGSSPYDAERRLFTYFTP